jgi:hypothetical protein
MAPFFNWAEKHMSCTLFIYFHADSPTQVYAVLMLYVRFG